jgi:hypothetical protein
MRLLIACPLTRVRRCEGAQLQITKSLAFGHASDPHALTDALASIAHCVRAVNGHGETRVESKARMCGGPRLLQLAKQRQGSREKEMCDRKIAVSLDATAQPSDRIRVGTKQHFF